MNRKTFHISLGAIAFLTQMGCGSVSDDPTERLASSVLNGYPAHPDDYPSICAIVVKSTRAPFCTCTMIADDVAITAAHCVSPDETDFISIVTNERVPRHAADANAHDAFSVDRYPKFDMFHSENNWHDVAVIVLRDRTKTIRPIDILDKKLSKMQIVPGSRVTIAGYGVNSLVTKESGELRVASVEIIAANEYEMSVGKPGTNEPNACWGDSGGPAYIDNASVSFLTGITSRSATNKAECGKGAIYTLPTPYKCWISDVIRFQRCLRDTSDTKSCVEGQIIAKLPDEIERCDVIKTTSALPVASGSEKPDAKTTDAGPDAQATSFGSPLVFEDKCDCSLVALGKTEDDKTRLDDLAIASVILMILRRFKNRSLTF